MFRYYVYIETLNFVVPVVVYAENGKDAYNIAINQFRKTFKSRVTKTVTHKDHYYFGGFEY